MEELFKQVETIHKQRIFFIGALQHLMEKDFEDRDATACQLAICEILLEQILNKGYVLKDVLEESLIKTIQDKLDREEALHNVKKSLHTPPDAF